VSRNREATLPLALLAGGLATRLRPLTDSLPKSLVDVNGEPFIAHQLRLLRDAGVTRVVMCCGYLGDQIRSAIGTGEQFGVQVSYSWDGPRLLGTAGALRKALPLLGDAFFVMYGDSYLPCDYAAIEAAFRDAGAPALITVFRNDNQFDRSNVEMNGGRIVAYDKLNPTARMTHIDYGLGVLTRQVVAELATDVPCDLGDVYRALLARGDLIAYEVVQRFYEIGSLDGLAEVRKYLATEPVPVRMASW
jgi:MurNAc alpha-1-phosphate uridylyltransferase